MRSKWMKNKHRVSWTIFRLFLVGLGGADFNLFQRDKNCLMAAGEYISRGFSFVAVK